MLSTEKKCYRVRHESNWSFALHLEPILCTYWLKTFKGHKNNIDITLQTKRLYDLLPKTIQSNIDNVLHNTSQSSILQISKQQLRQHINNKKQVALKSSIIT
jgi:hypothetical protein